MKIKIIKNKMKLGNVRNENMIVLMDYKKVSRSMDWWP